MTKKRKKNQTNEKLFNYMCGLLPKTNPTARDKEAILAGTRFTQPQKRQSVLVTKQLFCLSALVQPNAAPEKYTPWESSIPLER